MDNNSSNGKQILKKTYSRQLQITRIRSRSPTVSYNIEYSDKELLGKRNDDFLISTLAGHQERGHNSNLRQNKVEAHSKSEFKLGN